MKDGNSKQFSASGGIGMLSSRLTLGAPIVKDKGSFIISGRRTYADMFMALSSDPLKKNTKLYFYDLNAKANYRINDKNRIFLSGYFGRDEFKFDDMFSTDWGTSLERVRRSGGSSLRIAAIVSTAVSARKGARSASDS